MRDKDIEKLERMIQLNEISEFRGIAKGSKFTTDKLFEYRREERAFEDRRFKE